MTRVLTFTVLGKPQTSGSKRSFRHKHTGKQVTIPASDEQVNWQNRVADKGREVYDGPLLDVPLAIEFTFFRPRNQGDFGTGRNAGTVKASAPAYPATRPDLLKLARAVEDALSGIVYRDDAQIVQENLRKDYGEPERVEVIICTLERSYAERTGTLELVAATA
jgi:Holliday junction resolvase RusA-like endonuclease